MSSLTDISQFARLISEIKTDIQGILGVIAKMRNHYSEADLQTSAVSTAPPRRMSIVAVRLKLVSFLWEQRCVCDFLQGISFLELKNHLMLGYLQNLVLLMMKKTSGLSIDNDLATARIVEIRTVLEKMRFLEKKIQYQIDKLMKASEADQKPGGDPLSFKPKLDQMLAPGGADEEQTLEESGKFKKLERHNFCSYEERESPGGGGATDASNIVLDILVIQGPYCVARVSAILGMSSDCFWMLDDSSWVSLHQV